VAERKPEFGRFLQIAFGSACEVEYQLLLARDLGFLASQTYEGVNANVVEVKRMLNCLLKRIQRDIGYSTATSTAAVKRSAAAV
jgi:four helix bundle protein